MPKRNGATRYRPTESKYKGGADEMYVTYDLEQPTRGGGTAVYPRVKRVYIAGNVKDWKVGDFAKKSGKSAHGVRVEYEQRRGGYQREGYTATRGATTYHVARQRSGRPPRPSRTWWRCRKRPATCSSTR